MQKQLYEVFQRNVVTKRLLTRVPQLAHGAAENEFPRKAECVLSVRYGY